MVSDRRSQPLTVFLSPGPTSDAKGAMVLLAQLPPAKRMLGDKGHRAIVRHRSEDDGEGRRAAQRAQEPRSVRLHLRSRQAAAPGHSRLKLYRERCRIENALARPKDRRGTTTQLTPAAATGCPPPSRSLQPSIPGRSNGSRDWGGALDAASYTSSG